MGGRAEEGGSRRKKFCLIPATTTTGRREKAKRFVRGGNRPLGVTALSASFASTPA